MMSGSGPTVFGLFDDKKLAEHACEAIKRKPSCTNCFSDNSV